MTALAIVVAFGLTFVSAYVLGAWSGTDAAFLRGYDTRAREERKHSMGWYWVERTTTITDVARRDPEPLTDEQIAAILMSEEQ